ncbi:unnamed protein product [Brassicogethes aeneus]|uniref:Sorting nexin-14-like n=1 Tax=Brassicogethes aeneus TaxID=1431903 RepID=A0A9P0AQ26_BRAAE|nr:unnamed protein product [Brassicogethes aeneus]
MNISRTTLKRQMREHNLKNKQLNVKILRSNMLLKELTNVTQKIFGSKITSGVTIFVTLLAIVLAFSSPIAAAIVYSNFILGIILCWVLLRYKSKTNVYFQRLLSFYERRSSKKVLKHSCSICDDLSCQRHQQVKSAVPWKDIYIQEDLNNAVEHFYNRIIENFITSWYGQLTSNEDFILQLRYCLRYATSSIVGRFLEIDATDIILKKLVPCAIKHIDDYIYMQQIVKLQNARFDEVAVEYLGKNLHAATVNRKYELEYLQQLVKGIMNHVLPDSYLKCKNFSILIREILAGWVFLPLMDVLADPNIHNWLVVYAANYKYKKGKRHKSSEKQLIEIMKNFGFQYNNKNSSFYMGLSKLQSNRDMFYCLMQFLKKMEHVHLLQFCLNVDEFNQLLLKPDLTKEQLEKLHTDAQKLYKEYLYKDSVNYIRCSENISNEFNSLIKEGVHNIAKLRTSTPLFMAYEHTFSVLENIWLPQFYHSSEFYSYICGSKANSTYDKTVKSLPFNFGSPVRARKYNDIPIQTSTVSKISSGFGKIKGVLKANQPIEGALYPECHNLTENGTVDDLIFNETDGIFRDLGSWRLFITDYRQSPTSKDMFFRINIVRLDNVPEGTKKQWEINRREQDFFSLKAKLIEFHGESEISDSPLPSRKSNPTIETKKEKYETFIRKLLQKPLLRGSDLLYIFLTSEEDFTELLVNSTPMGQELGNIYQSVAHKLRKEKGQNLDPFMTAFLNSTGKSSKGKFDWAEFGDDMEVLSANVNRVDPFPKTYRNHIFNDNFGINYHSLKEGSSSSLNMEGLTNSIFYLMKFIFKVPHSILQIYAMFCNSCGVLIDFVLKRYIDYKLKSSLSQTNLAHLIGLLEEVVFQQHTSPLKEELEIRKQKAFKGLEEMIHPWINKKIFKGSLSNGMLAILEILQNPHYNKHLVYNLLDIILVEMYPSLGKVCDNI